MKIENLFDFDNETNKEESDTLCDRFRLKDIVPGDVIAFRNQYYLMDPENFHFEKIDARESKIDKQKIKKFLKDKKINISADEFMVLWNFQTWVKMTYPEHRKYEPLRSATLKMAKNSYQNPMPLSEAFNRKIVMCTEMSALAQMYLQHRGIESVLYSGNAFTDANANISFGGAGHAWLMITLSGKKYFYDPVNPIIGKNLLLPAIMDYSDIPKEEVHDFENIIHKSTDQGGGFAYLEAKDIYNTGRNWLYGFEHGYHRQRKESSVKRQKNKHQIIFSHMNNNEK